MATSNIDVKKLLEAGAHFGHKTSRWHPKMAQYIHSKRDGIHIIDLYKTVDALQNATEFLSKVSKDGKQVLFVGTKRQSKDIIKKAAEETSMPYVCERWLGGMLTNQKTMSERIKHLRDLEIKMDSGALAAKYNKLELQKYQEEIEDMNFLYGGIKEMSIRPGAVFVTDMINDANAIREAIKLDIPVVAIADTNADPSLVKYPIPCNDDAIKSIQQIVDYIKEAILAGKKQQKTITKSTQETKVVGEKQ